MFTDKRRNIRGKATPMRGKDYLIASVVIYNMNGAVHRLNIEVASAMHRPFKENSFHGNNIYFSFRKRV